MKAAHFLFRWWTAFALALALAMLGFAHTVELMGYPPCHLCLKQREVYWMAVALAAPATVWALFFRSKGTPRLAAFLLFAIFATGAIIAGYHAGVELKWWKGPQTCTGGAMGFDSADLGALLAGGTLHVVQCDVVSVAFLGISMAAWNAIASAILALLSLIASMRRRDERRAG